mmetsp:Transcript_2100/g.4006  ORF Transcript_2100/g.4006 Transcript_2100/m.4006 type:complete len:254 (-) Transcript_2100:1-762(-)
MDAAPSNEQVVKADPLPQLGECREPKLSLELSKTATDSPDQRETQSAGRREPAEEQEQGQGTLGARTGGLERKVKPQLCRLESLSVSMDVSEMLPFLFLGAKAVSEDKVALDNFGIRHIVNCTLEKLDHFEKDGVKYFHVHVDDSATADIAPYFRQTGEFIEQARQQSSKVLVHCTMGMSRSSTIVLAYLMEYHQMPLAVALGLAKDRRAMVSPNSGFMKQLSDFEMELFNKTTINLEAYKKSRFADVSAFSL